MSVKINKSYISNVLDVDIVDGDPVHCFDDLFKSWDDDDNCKVLNYLYFSSFVIARNDSEYHKALKLSDSIFVDGIALRVYFYFMNGFWVRNNNGTDVNPLLLDNLLNKNVHISFYGGSQSVIDSIRKKVEERVSGCAGFTFQNGYSSFDLEHIPYKSVLFVALGSPLQEKWVQNNFAALNKKKVFVITVGGWFDFFSGNTSRAPSLMIKLKLEWLFRLFKDPKTNYIKVLRSLSVPIVILRDKLKC